jgi:hypothetical protein
MNLTSPYLSNTAFLTELRNYKGLIPVSIELASEKILWVDMAAYHFYDGFFRKSLDIYYALKKNTVVSFMTDLNILEDDRVLTEPVYPTAFIFHAGRSGSTLLAKTLARSPENLVISEAAPLNQILLYFTEGGKTGSEIDKKNEHIYRNLLLCLFRKRLSTYRHFVVKFTSYNIYFFNFITSAFPGVKSVFLTRTQEEILASFGKNPPAWLNDKTDGMFKKFTGSDEPDLSAIIDSFFKSADEKPTEVLRPIDYKMLTPDNFSVILSYLGIEHSEEQLNLMKSQFAFDSKVEFNKSRFKA